MENDSIKLKYANELNNSMNAIRSANERILRLSQRLGRMIPKFQNVDHNVTGIYQWYADYNLIKDYVNQTNKELQKVFNELLPLMNKGEISFDLTTIFPLTDYSNQLNRFFSKIEVIDDILYGIWEDMVDGIAFTQMQKEQMKKALDETMKKSKTKNDAMFG